MTEQTDHPEIKPANQTIAIASDHAGYTLKKQLTDWLVDQDYLVDDYGPFSDERVDYPDYATYVAEAVADDQADLGVLICGTGIGMAIAANKIPKIRAANLTSPEFARLAREHNHANIAALSARFVDLATNQSILAAFLNAEPQGDRHALRVDKINALDTYPSLDIG